MLASLPFDPKAIKDTDMNDMRRLLNFGTEQKIERVSEGRTLAVLPAADGGGPAHNVLSRVSAQLAQRFISKIGCWNCRPNLDGQQGATVGEGGRCWHQLSRELWVRVLRYLSLVSQGEL